MLEGVTAVKVILIGRPSPWKPLGRDGMYGVVTVSSTVPSTLPRGLPAAPTQPVTWPVWITKRQWNTVAATLAADVHDKAVIEGHATVDAEKRVVIFAQSITTVAQQRAKREAQKAASATAAVVSADAQP